MIIIKKLHFSVLSNRMAEFQILRTKRRDAIVAETAWELHNITPLKPN